MRISTVIATVIAAVSVALVATARGEKMFRGGRKGYLLLFPAIGEGIFFPARGDVDKGQFFP